MNDMSQVIIPRSDQLNAEDFLAGPKSFTIESVEIRAGTEQPVTIKLVGESRAWKPCKSMSRVLVAAWGPDANAYPGRSVTLYNDPKVKWGGMEIGGIRVSHMSHIEREMLLQLTATKGKRAPHIVKPLQSAPKLAEVHQHPANERTQTEQADVEKRTDAWADKYIDALKNAMTDDELAGIRKRQSEKLAWVRDNYPAIYARVIEADPHSAIDPAQPELTDN